MGQASDDKLLQRIRCLHGNHCTDVFVDYNHILLNTPHTKKGQSPVKSTGHHLQSETGSSDVIKVSELIAEIPGLTEARHQHC